jgi:hypothetical protein
VNSIQLIRFFDVLGVTDFAHATGVVPRAVRIQGRDYKAVEVVNINGVPSPEFIVVNERNIIAQVPAQLELAALQSVSVLGSSLSFGEQSLVDFTFGKRAKIARGKARMVQVFLRMLMRTPGTNLFNKESGGGILSIMGSNFLDHGSLAGAVSTAVGRAQRSVIRAQTSDRGIPTSERLLSAKLLSVDADQTEFNISARVLLTAHDGAESGATIIT